MRMTAIGACGAKAASDDDRRVMMMMMMMMMMIVATEERWADVAAWQYWLYCFLLFVFNASHHTHIK